MTCCTKRWARSKGSPASSHPFAQGLLEVELPAHGALGDLGHLGLAIGQLRQLVDELALREGRIDVETDQPLGPTVDVVSLDRHVDGQRARQGQDLATQCGQLERTRRATSGDSHRELDTGQDLVAQGAYLSDTHLALGEKARDLCHDRAIAQILAHRRDAQPGQVLLARTVLDLVKGRRLQPIAQCRRGEENPPQSDRFGRNVDDGGESQVSVQDGLADRNQLPLFLGDDTHQPRGHAGAIGA